MTIIALVNKKLYGDRLMKAAISDHSGIDRFSNKRKIYTTPNNFVAFGATGLEPTILIDNLKVAENVIVKCFYDYEIKKEYNFDKLKDLLPKKVNLLLCSKNTYLHIEDETIIILNKDDYFLLGSAALYFRAGLDTGRKMEKLFLPVSFYSMECSEEFDFVDLETLNEIKVEKCL